MLHNFFSRPLSLLGWTTAMLFWLDFHQTQSNFYKWFRMQQHDWSSTSPKEPMLHFSISHWTGYQLQLASSSKHWCLHIEQPQAQHQGDLGPGSLELREGVASCRAWAPSISPTLRRSGPRGGWCWFSCLLSRPRSGATGNRRRAGSLREEVSNHLRRLLSLREVFSKALHSLSKQAAWRNRSVEEGNFVRLFHLRHREPEVVLQHYQAGHWMPDGFGGM